MKQKSITFLAGAAFALISLPAFGHVYHGRLKDKHDIVHNRGGQIPLPYGLMLDRIYSVHHNKSASSLEVSKRIFAYATTLLSQNAVKSKTFVPKKGRILHMADFECLKNEIIYEARGESDTGQIGVAAVAHNRAIAKNTTHCQIIYARKPHHRHSGCQFEFACEKHTKVIPQDAIDRAKTIAYAILANGVVDVTRGSTFFHTCTKGKSTDDFTFVRKIGNHCYYNERNKDEPDHRINPVSYILKADDKAAFGYRIEITDAGML